MIEGGGPRFALTTEGSDSTETFEDELGFREALVKRGIASAQCDEVVAALVVRGILSIELPSREPDAPGDLLLEPARS